MRDAEKRTKNATWAYSVLWVGQVQHGAIIGACRGGRK